MSFEKVSNSNSRWVNIFRKNIYGPFAPQSGWISNKKAASSREIDIINYEDQRRGTISLKTPKNYQVKAFKTKKLRELKKRKTAKNLNEETKEKKRTNKLNIFLHKKKV